MHALAVFHASPSCELICKKMSYMGINIYAYIFDDAQMCADVEISVNEKERARESKKGRQRERARKGKREM